MSFDKDAFARILARYEDRVAAFYHLETRPPGFRTEKVRGRDEVTVHAFGIKDRSMSKHRQLLRDVLLGEINDDMQDLDILLRRAFPALDNDCLSFELESFAGNPGGRGAKFRFSIREGGRRDAAVLLSTATARIAMLHDRIGHLPRAERTYLVNEEQVPAAAPQDALRIFLALHRPDLFEAGANIGGSHFTVSEICPVSTLDALS